MHPPRASSSRRHGAEHSPARACAVGLVTGPHARTPRARGNHGSRPQPPAPRTDGRARENAQPRTPLNTTGEQERRRKDRPPPPHQQQAQQGTRAGNAEGHELPGMALPASCKGTSRRARAKRQREGGRHEHRGSPSTQTHSGHTARTNRATGPSWRNARTTLNGVPAGEDKGHPDGATRHKHREGREGGTARGGGGTRSGTGPALLTCRERCSHSDRAVHLPRE